MNQIVDPRKHGFNYGAGWGSAPYPPLLLTAQKAAFELGQRARVYGDQAWSLEMACRDVRLASNGVEKAMMMQKLERVFDAHRAIFTV